MINFRFVDVLSQVLAKKHVVEIRIAEMIGIINTCKYSRFC